MVWTLEPSLSSLSEQISEWTSAWLASSRALMRDGPLIDNNTDGDRRGSRALVGLLLHWGGQGARLAPTCVDCDLKFFLFVASAPASPTEVGMHFGGILTKRKYPHKFG